ncbi:hypothetical protein FA13DRAFT_757741 [Coprinellus micaceus]|uniref:Nephrocystin 3-like N-terminal domain-containing protein n=1 Tax=Coprinellus micaceus TaxID=71717 RepID=A0A4Y7T5B0_COPMI|nr:hypothetical protein FA13DRAFT_757741 [Coprinellus micaceus]
MSNSTLPPLFFNAGSFFTTRIHSMATQAGSHPSLERGQSLHVPSSCLGGSSNLPAGSSGTWLPSRAPSQKRQTALATQRPQWYARLRSAWARWWGRGFISHDHHGDTYHTMNANTAPVTTIQYATNVNMGGQMPREDFLEKLPKHPDLGERWADYSRDSRSFDLEKIWTWADDQDGELVFWIHSDSGQGKSTLARQLRGELRSKDRLAGAIFLTLLESKGLESVVRLIGGEIGIMHRGVTAMVVAAIDSCHGASLKSHIEEIIRDPLLALQPLQPLIIIIDGVTEWRLHANFIEQLEQLVPYASTVRFIVLGRAVPREGRYKNVPIQCYALPFVSGECMAGCLNDRFDTIEWKDGRRPSPEDVLRLSALANGQFTQMEEVVSVIHNLPPSKHNDISKPIYNMALSIAKPASTERLDHKIMLNRIALALRPPGHPKRHYSLNNLAFSLGSRYRKSRLVADLEELILLHRQALALRRPGHPHRYYSCHNLASSLHDRFRKDGRIGDLEEAIALGREALWLCPEGHQDRFDTVENQLIFLDDRFKVKGAVEDLQEATTLAEETLSLCPKDNQGYPMPPSWISSRIGFGSGYGFI